ncbi:Hypothetical protein R9X50_00420000 [Acrodontium crateriforme]|uniref:C3H1-type domain-containing protein n=1 Tax=Acrodontium crateriforme TaxID=150365 RepID=A0AAQ3M744_9PEZI|nr:Hypothetical protein R9X50_00420000 [Acrodontium crateriforme]
MNGNTSPPNYQALLEGFRRSDAQRDELVVEIIQNYQKLQSQYDMKCDDYNNEVESRRMWQMKARAAESALSDERQVSGSSPFVLVIIDGDGAIFQDMLLAAGKEGGADAAHQLQVEIRNQLRALYPEGSVGDWNIVVQIILNLQGLGTKLQSSGIILNPNELAAFGRQFGLTQPLFSFVDVGGGKERADHKIRETLRLYLPIAQFLEPYRRDPNISARLTLIETRPAEPGFVELGLRRIRLPRIFRSEDLNCGLQSYQPRTQRSENDLFEFPEHIVERRDISKPITKPSPIARPSQTTTSRAPSTDSSASASTWATVGSKGVPGVGKINITAKKQPVRKFMLLNAYDERMDQELPKTDSNAEYRFSERARSKGKLCNNYHLTGKCGQGEFCDYHHGERLTPGEQLVLKHKARSLHCPTKFGCRDFACFLGHHCKFGNKCHLDYCRFADTHDAELEPAKKFYEDQSEEWMSSYLNASNSSIMRSVYLAFIAAVSSISPVSAIAVAQQEVLTAVQLGQQALNAAINDVLHNDLPTAQIDYNIAAAKIGDLGYFIDPPQDACSNSASGPHYNKTSQKSQQSIVGALESVQIRLTCLSTSLLFNNTPSALAAWQFSMATLDSTYDYIFADQYIDNLPSHPANASAAVFGDAQMAQSSLNLLIYNIQSGDRMAAQAQYQTVSDMLYNDLAPMVPCNLDGKAPSDPCIAAGTGVAAINLTQIVGCVQSVQLALVGLAGDVIDNKSVDDHCAIIGQDFKATHDFIFE